MWIFQLVFDKDLKSLDKDFSIGSYYNYLLYILTNFFAV